MALERVRDDAEKRSGDGAEDGGASHQVAEMVVDAIDQDDAAIADAATEEWYARTKPRPRRLSGEYAGGESDDSSYNTYDSRHERDDKHLSLIHI